MMIIIFYELPDMKGEDFDPTTGEAYVLTNMYMINREMQFIIA
jgi:hypothetical protein